MCVCNHYMHEINLGLDGFNHNQSRSTQRTSYAWDTGYRMMASIGK